MTHFDRFMESITKLTKLLIVLVAGVMITLVFSQVITRYIVGSTPSYIIELASYCLIWISFLGSSIAIRWGKHVALTAMVDRMPENSRRIINYISNGLVLIFLIIFLIASYQYALGQWEQFSPTLGFRITWPALGPVIGTFLMILQLIHNNVSPALTEQEEEGVS